METPAPAAAGRTVQRWAAAVEYRGTSYSGWQAQGQAPSVQAAVERALSAVADVPTRVTAAGRTDAGVHALGQVVHFDTPAPRSAYAWLLGVNSLLPPDVSLLWTQPVEPGFHARYSALARHYRYVFLNRRARSGLLAQRASWQPRPLDAGAMHRAAQALVGEHDFSAYRGSDCQSRTPMRNVTAIAVRRHGDFVVLEVTANAFLHHMVRNIAGVLQAIGQGRQDEAWAGALLAGRDRTRGGVTAPPEGLYFVGPDYPPGFGLPGRPEPWFPGTMAP